MMTGKNYDINRPGILFKFTWPIFLEAFLQYSLGFVDMFMLSHYSDSAAGAVGVANQVILFFTIILKVVSSGAVILIAQYIGAGKKAAAEEIAVTALISNPVVGLVISSLLFGFRYEILRVMNCPGEFMEYGQQFMGIVGGTRFLEALFLVMASILYSHGCVRNSMYISLATNALKIVGNYLFIFGPFGIPVLGVKGVAFSTAASQVIGVIALYWVMVRKTRIRISLKCFSSFSRKAFAKLMKIGLPSTGEQLIFDSSQLVITFIISFMGAAALSARVYTNTVTCSMELIVCSIGFASKIIIAHLVGAGKKEETYKTCFKSVKAGMIITVGISIAVYLFGEPIFGIFTKDRSIISMGRTLILITTLTEPFKVLNIVIASCLRGAGNVRFPAIMVFIFGVFLNIPLSYLLGIHFMLGLTGVWLVFLVDECVRGLIMLWKWKSRDWEKVFYAKDGPESKSQRGETLEGFSV